MLLFAMLSPAFALVAREPCMGYFVTDSVPRPGALDVPIDVVPTVIFADNGCGATSNFNLELYRLDGSESTLLGMTSVQASGGGVSLGSYDLLATALEPLTDYMLRVAPVDGVAEVSEIGFTTGEATRAGLSEVPELTITDSGAYKSERIWSLRAMVLIEPAEDPDLLSIVTVPHPDEDRLLAASVVDSTESIEALVAFVPEDLPKELCLQVEQLDGAQRSSGLSDPACERVDKHRSLRGNCSTSGGAAGLFPALLALLLARRTR